MENSIKSLTEKFKKIQAMGFIKSTRKGFSGTGKTFEDLIEKKEDNLDDPDYQGIEIKTKLDYSQSYTSLFNFAPKGNHHHEIKYLQETYGYPDKSIPNAKVFQNFVYASNLTNIGTKFTFILKINYKQKKIFLTILDYSLNIVEQTTYWEFSELEKKLYGKLKYLAYVNVKQKQKNGQSYYHYYKIRFYKLKDFNTFLHLIEDGTIRINFHIGVHKSGIHKGEIHDHGTSFQIQEKNLLKLFDEIDTSYFLK